MRGATWTSPRLVPILLPLLSSPILILSWTRFPRTLPLRSMPRPSSTSPTCQSLRSVSLCRRPPLTCSAQSLLARPQAARRPLSTHNSLLGPSSLRHFHVVTLTVLSHVPTSNASCSLRPAGSVSPGRADGRGGPTLLAGWWSLGVASTIFFHLLYTSCSSSPRFALSIQLSNDPNQKLLTAHSDVAPPTLVVRSLGEERELSLYCLKSPTVCVCCTLRWFPVNVDPGSPTSSLASLVSSIMVKAAVAFDVLGTCFSFDGVIA